MEKIKDRLTVSINKNNSNATIEDVTIIALMVNQAIDKINELVGEINELKEKEK